MTCASCVQFASTIQSCWLQPLLQPHALLILAHSHCPKPRLHARGTPAYPVSGYLMRLLISKDYRTGQYAAHLVHVTELAPPPPALNKQCAGAADEDAYEQGQSNPAPNTNSCQLLLARTSWL